MTIGDINLDIEEGRLLLAAIVWLQVETADDPQSILNQIIMESQDYGIKGDNHEKKYPYIHTYQDKDLNIVTISANTLDELLIGIKKSYESNKIN